MDNDALEQWLNNRTDELGAEKGKQIAVWIASRIALRVLPIVLTDKYENLTPAVLWCTMISRVAGNSPTRDTAARAADAIYTAARAAYTAARAARAAYTTARAADAAYTTARAADAIYAAARAADAADAAARAARAAYTAADAADAADAALDTDIRWLTEQDYQIPDTPPPLWHDQDYPLQEDWNRAKTRLGADYRFFIDDYERLLQGKKPDWAVLFALAHPDATEAWESGDITQINAIIHEVQQNRAIDQTQYAAELSINPATGLIQELQDIRSDDALLDQAADEIEEALASINDLSGNFAKALLSPVGLKLERTLDKRHKAGRLHSTAIKAQEQIVLLWQRNDLGDPYKDPDIVAIMRHLDSVSVNLLAHSAIKDMTLQKLEPPQQPEQIAALKDAVEKTVAASEPELATEMEADYQISNDPDEDEFTKQDAQYFTFARILRAAKLAISTTAAISMAAIAVANSLIKLQNYFTSALGQTLLNFLYRLF